MDDLQQRLIELEIRYAHQAQLQEDLNRELQQCNQRLIRLERDNELFREMLRHLAPEAESSPDE